VRVYSNNPLVEALESEIEEGLDVVEVVDAMRDLGIARFAQVCASI